MSLGSTFRTNPWDLFPLTPCPLWPQRRQPHHQGAAQDPPQQPAAQSCLQLSCEVGIGSSGLIHRTSKVGSPRGSCCEANAFVGIGVPLLQVHCGPAKLWPCCALHRGLKWATHCGSLCFVKGLLSLLVACMFWSISLGLPCSNPPAQELGEGLGLVPVAPGVVASEGHLVPAAGSLVGQCCWWGSSRLHHLELS